MRSEEVLRQQLLEEADSPPRGADGASHKDGVAEDGGGQTVECCDWSAVEGFVGGEVED